MAEQNGDTTSNITNVWAYYNNNPIGVYNVPSLFPVLAQGNTFTQLSPGIEENGLQETRSIYPFYTYDTMTVNFQANHTSTFIPHFTYRSNTKFPLIAEFENNNGFQTFDSGNVKLNTYSNPSIVKYGKSCGYALLNSQNSNFQVESIQPDSLPNSSPVYVEMDYMCTIPFSIGIVDIQNGVTFSANYFEQINPISTWNKIYINLSPYLTQTGKNLYQIAFGATLPQGKSEGQIYLDNIKLVHF